MGLAAGGSVVTSGTGLLGPPSYGKVAAGGIGFGGGEAGAGSVRVGGSIDCGGSAGRTGSARGGDCTTVGGLAGRTGSQTGPETGPG